MHALIAFLSQHRALALAVVFAAALLESVAGIGALVPGSSIILAPGVPIGLQALDPLTVLSAGAWSALHLLPGALFGASLQPAGTVNFRLLIALAELAAVVWLCAALLRFTQRSAWPALSRWRDGAVAWARHCTGLLPRVALSLLDPAQPEPLGLLIAALMLLGGAWLFFGVLQDVVSSDPLVRFDHLVCTALQQLRTGGGEDLMIATTKLGGAMGVITGLALVSLVLAWRRCWRAHGRWPCTRAPMRTHFRVVTPLCASCTTVSWRSCCCASTVPGSEGPRCCWRRGWSG